MDRSLLLARQAVALDDSPTTRSDLLAALLRAPAVTAVVPGTGNPITAVDVDPDGRRLALGDDRGNLLLVDTRTHRRIGASQKLGASIATVRFSPDGARLAVAGYTLGTLGFIDLVDPRTHRDNRLSTGFDSTVKTSGVLATGTIAFSPDSTHMAADILADGPPSGYRRYVVRWDASNGHRLGSPIAISSRAPSSNLGDAPTLKERRDPGGLLVGFIDGGTRVLTSSATDGSTAIRDATTLRSLRRFPGAGARAAVSPDGRLAALAPVNGRLRLLDLATGRARLIRGDGGSVTALRFTPDSHWLVIARGDAPPLVWDVRREIPLKTLAGLRNVTQLTIVADGTTLYGAGKQGDVTAWDLTGARGLQRSFRTGPTSAAVFAVTPGSQTFAVANRAGYVDLLDSRTLDRTARIHAPAATRIAISRDGRTIATADRAGAVGFIDLQTGRPLGTAQHAHIGRVLSLAFSPRGDWLASSGADRAVYLWDARRRRPVKLYSIPPGSALPPTGLSFNPDGTRLAVAIAHSDGTGELDVLSVPRFALVAKVPVAPGGQTEFSRDGRRLLYRDDSGQVWTIDTRTWRVRGLTVGGRAKPGDFALAPDNRRLATTSGDGTAQLWDISSGRTIGSPLGVGVTRPVSATFVAGGTALVTLADDGRGAVWDLRPRAWQTRACTIAGRPLTRAEWRHVLPDRPYEPACAHGAG